MNPNMKKQILIYILFGAVTAAAREPLYDRVWGDPEVELRIRTGIETSRMGFATLRFADAAGQPVSGVEVEFRQTRHDFLFGANIFMLGGFATPELNRRYEEVFRRTFNFATAPFYWSDLEPEEGKPRFGVDSPFIARRPPPDLVLEFCQRHQIMVKGHTLMWHQWLPSWLPPDQEGVAKAARRRMEQIASRYGKSIPVWDVVNEAVERFPNVVEPKDYVFWSLQEAARLFPPEAVLMVNEANTPWSVNFRHEDSYYYLLLQNLLLRGARIDAIGLQFHLNYLPENLRKEMWAGKSLTPLDMLRVMDLYGQFKRPVHITEISIPTPPGGATGEQDQGIMVRNLYRLWFSHPAVEAITWWNLADGTAVAKENSWRAGLLREDLSPKPAFQAVDDLIHKEWWTRLERNSGSASQMRLHGFYGAYEITAKWNGKSVRQQVQLSKTGTNQFELRFDGK